MGSGRAIPSLPAAGYLPEQRLHDPGAGIDPARCQVLDAKAGSLVGEIWNEGVAEDSLPELEGIYQREICDRVPISREEARDFLLGIIEREIEPFEYKAEQFAKKAELEAKLTPRIAAFDESPEGELLRRYESMWERLLFRYLGELRNRRSEKAQSAEQDYKGSYLRPSPEWIKSLIDARTAGTKGDDSVEERDLVDCDGDRNTSEVDSEPASDGTAGEQEETELVRAEVPAAGDQSEEPDLRDSRNGNQESVLDPETNGVTAEITQTVREDQPTAVPGHKRGVNMLELTRRQQRRLRKLERKGVNR